MILLFLLYVIGIVVRFRGINLDATNHCSLKCPGCARQRFVDGLNGFEDIVGPVPGRPITLEEMDKITDYFEEISFCKNIDSNSSWIKSLNSFWLLIKEKIFFL